MVGFEDVGDDRIASFNKEMGRISTEFHVDRQENIKMTV